MPMSEAYRNAIAELGAGLVAYIGLVDDRGVELSGGLPAYRRLPAAWRPAVAGLVKLSANLTFVVPPGATVAGWRGFSGAEGGTDYGGEPLPAERFLGQGEYVLLADGTGISHEAVQR